MAVAAAGACPVPYSRRRPEHTVLYRLVQAHLETYLALARDGDGDAPGVPRSVEREFRHSLTCGILAGAQTPGAQRLAPSWNAVISAGPTHLESQDVQSCRSPLHHGR